MKAFFEALERLAAQAVIVLVFGGALAVLALLGAVLTVGKYAIAWRIVQEWWH